MGRNTVATQEVIDRVVEMTRNGYTLKEIAEVTGISRTSVGSIRTSTGVHSTINGGTRTKISQETVDTIVRMTKGGASNADICRATSLSFPTVRNYQKKNGVYLANRREAREAVAEPQVVTDDMVQYVVVVELSDRNGTRFVRTFDDIYAKTKRDAILEAVRRVNVNGYRGYWKVVRSVGKIGEEPEQVKIVEKEEKVEEIPMNKSSTSRINVLSSTRTFEIEGSDTGIKYYVSIEGGVIRLSVGDKSLAKDFTVEIKTEDIESFGAELFEIIEILTMLSGEAAQKGA